MRDNPNPPAYPVDCNTNPDSDAAGMTLRDWFAGMALQGLIVACDKFDELTNERDAARMAYRQADAMLKARGA